MQEFAGKVAVVTGAGSGIGQALAIKLAQLGAKVAISDMVMDGLAQTEERLRAIGAPSKPTSSTSPSAKPSRPTPTR